MPKRDVSDNYALFFISFADDAHKNQLFLFKKNWLPTVDGTYLVFCIFPDKGNPLCLQHNRQRKAIQVALEEIQTHKTLSRELSYY